MAFLLCVGCADFLTGPGASIDAWVIAADPPSMLGVSVSDGIVRRLSLSAAPDVAVRSADGTEILTAAGAGGPLMASDINTGRTLWHETLASTTKPNLGRWNGLVVGGQGTLAQSADSRFLFVAPAFSDTTNNSIGSPEGVAVLDGATRNLVTWIHPVYASGAGVAAIPAVGTGPGYAVIAGYRARDPAGDSYSSDGWLYKVDMSTLTIVDSADGASGAGGEGLLSSPKYGAAANAIYVWEAGVGGIAKLSWPSLQRVASAPTPWVQYDIGPDGSVYVAVPNPATGNTALVHFDSNLHEMARLDFGPDPVTGAPPKVLDVAVSPSGDRVYVTVGTDWVAIDITPQNARLLVVDVPHWTLKSIPLGGTILPAHVIPRR